MAKKLKLKPKWPSQDFFKQMKVKSAFFSVFANYHQKQKFHSEQFWRHFNRSFSKSKFDCQQSDKDSNRGPPELMMNAGLRLLPCHAVGFRWTGPLAEKPKANRRNYRGYVILPTCLGTFPNRPWDESWNGPRNFEPISGCKR